jgi:hypothetical protein
VVLHFHLLHEYRSVTTIAFKDGTVYMQGDKVSTGEQCCCDDRCPLGECEITIEFLDENRCEDDVFDLYLKNPTTEVERFIQEVDLASTPAGGCGDPSAEYANIIIPVTVTETDFDETCNVIIGLRFVSANCCNTYARFRIRRPNGCLLFGQYFGQAGLETTYTWYDLCNDDPCPPEPPEPCCSKKTECENGTLINRCGSDSAQQCCSTYADDNDDAIDECSGEDPPVTSCEENGNTPANVAPYDCINDSFQGGAWVTVDEWTAFDPDETDPDTIALYEEADSKVNQTFFVPFTCLGSATETIDLGVGAGADRTTAGTRCDDANWFAEVSVNLCARTASVAVSNDSCWSAFEIQINLSDLTAITVPCNAWTGCNCAAFSDSNEGFGGGTVSVDLLEP